MDRRRFDRLVRRAVLGVPRKFRKYLRDVVIAVQDQPSPDLLEDMGADSLLGIYLGTPLTERMYEESFRPPDRILIFQRPLEAMCVTESELVEEIRITVVHEIGHHFGLSEEEVVEALGE